MNKLINYILRGKGLGLMFLLASSVMIASFYLCMFKLACSDFKPAVVLVAEEVLPIKVENGKIVEPYNEYKETGIKIGKDKEKNDEIKVVLDTRDDVVYDKFDDGIYITKDGFVASINKKSKKVELSDGVFDIEKFKGWLDGYLAVVSGVLAIVIIGASFVGGLIKCLVAMLIMKWVVKTKLEDALDKNQLMRLCALVVAAFELLSIILLIGLDVSISGIVLYLIILACIFIAVDKIIKQMGTKSE